MFAALRRLLTPDTTVREAAQAYTALVEYSRAPFFYTQCAVPDTLDGRFEMVLAHLFLLNERLVRTPQEFAHDFATQLANVFFADMDRNLREMGVGDTSVGKKIRPMAQAYYGRLKSYREAWSDEVAFEAALTRNVYGTCESVDAESIRRLAAYLRNAADRIEKCPAQKICAGQISFDFATFS